jgi:hypothetical protein
MKSKILLFIAIILLFIGILLKFAGLQLAGTLIAFGLTLFIIWISIYYGSKGKLTITDILSLSFSIAFSAWIFKVIQSRLYIEILIVAMCIGLITFLSTILIRILKKSTKPR